MHKRWTTLLFIVSTGLAGHTHAQVEPQSAFEPLENKAQTLRRSNLLFLAESTGPFTALSYQQQFTADALAGGDTAQLRIALAEQATAYGLFDAASAQYPRNISRYISYEEKNDNWYRLAKAWFARGDYAKAQKAFDNIYGDVAEDIKEDLVPFEARLLLAQNQNKKTIKLLRKWQRKRIRNPFARYDLAVALARAGQTQEGVGELNEIGTLKSKTPLHLALRDQANLVLGFGYLEIGQGATARSLFQRIRLEGPYANNALLGLGWAELAPDGDSQEHTLVQVIRCIEDPARLLPDNLPVLRRVPRDACGPPQYFRDTDRFKTQKGGETEAEKYQRALVPWLELIRRDPNQSAVQEALTAVPYAYAKINARELADDYYATAIKLLAPQYEKAHFIVQQLENGTDRGDVLPPGVEPDRDWFALRWGLYTAADTPFFTQVLTEEHFDVAAQSLQDLLVLRNYLINNSDRSAALNAMLNGRYVALYRGGIDMPEQLLEQQNALDATTKRMITLRQKVEDAIYGLGEYLRKQALAKAKDHERRLQTYLTNARVGRVNLANSSAAQSATE